MRYLITYFVVIWIALFAYLVFGERDRCDKFMSEATCFELLR